MIKYELLKQEHIDYDFCALLNQLSPSSFNSDKLVKSYFYISSSPFYYIWVAIDEEAENKVVGIGTLFIEYKLIRGGVKCGHVEDVVTDNNYRGQGIGKEIIRRLVKTAKQHKCYKTILNCSKENAPFYEKCGFRKTEICMRKDLDGN